MRTLRNDGKNSLMNPTQGCGAYCPAANASSSTLNQGSGTLDGKACHLKADELVLRIDQRHPQRSVDQTLHNQLGDKNSKENTMLKISASAREWKPG